MKRDTSSLVIVDDVALNDTLEYNVTSPSPGNGSASNETKETPKQVPAPFYRAQVVSRREFIISNLGHYEDYNIEVNIVV